MEQAQRFSKKRPAVLLGLTAAALLSLSPLPGQAQSETPQRGGTLIFTLGSDPAFTNKVISSSFAEGQIGCIVYQGLTIPSSDWDPKPLLAKSWTISPDGLTYTFELNKAQWHDGQPFTSEDVKYSFLDINSKYNPAFAASARAIASIDTPAPDRAVIHLKQPFGPFLISLACSHGGAILPAHLFRGTNPLQNPVARDKPVGTGAFMLQERKSGDYIRLVRNPNYWEPGKPYLDEVIAKIIGQPTGRLQALQAGEVDYVHYFYLPSNNYGLIRANPNLLLTPAKAPAGLDMMLLNNSKKPFDDKRVRKALFMAIDRDYLLKNAYFNTGGVGTMPFTNGITWAINPDIDFRKMYPYDPARAEALLDEAGLKRGANGTRFQTTITYMQDQSDSALVAAAVKSMWAAIGVELTIKPGEQIVAYQSMFTARDFDTAIGAYNSYQEPALGMARIYSTSTIGQILGNGAGYSNPVVDKLLDQGESAVGNEARAVFYRQAQAILADDLPALSIHERVFEEARSKRVRGLENEIFNTTWRDAWIAK